ncbi:MAG: hypothetical protein ABIN83_02935 [Sphingomicrobium sp.]
MTVGKRIARLFVIKTRFEAYLVIFAIAMGAIERGRRYMEIYPGNAGYLLALAATGVVFIAGAKLLDSVRPLPASAVPVRAVSRRRIARNRPRRNPRPVAARSAISHRPD